MFLAEHDAPPNARFRTKLSQQDKDRPKVCAPVVTARSKEVPILEQVPPVPDYERHVLTNTLGGASEDVHVDTDRAVLEDGDRVSFADFEFRIALTRTEGNS